MIFCQVLLRFIGWLLTWLGLQLLTGPLTIFPDIIPFVGPCIGDLMGAALCCVTLMVSLASSLFVGAIAWIFVRPVLSLTLLGLASVYSVTINFLSVFPATSCLSIAGGDGCELRPPALATSAGAGGG